MKGLDPLTRVALSEMISTEGIIIGADSDASGTDGVQIQTRSLTRLKINNDGSIQSYKNASWLVGESGAESATAGPALKLATGAAVARYNWRTRTAPFTNGPGGETNYDDHVMLFGFNPQSNGVAEVGGLVSFGLSLEHRFYEVDHFQSEHIEYWNSPDGTVSRRGRQTNYHYDGRVAHAFNGDFSINQSNATGDPWVVISEDDDAIRFQSGKYLRIETNNIDALVQKNAAGSNVIPLIRLNASDVVQIGGGQPVTVSGTATIGTASVGAFNFGGNGDANTDIANIADGYIQLRSNGTGKFYIAPDGIHMQAVVQFDGDNTNDIGQDGSTRPRNVYVGTDVKIGGVFKVAANQVVGAQGAAVADATDATTVITQLNALLARARAHGLIAT